MITENLSTLKIHKLTQEQYDRELAAGRIDENALYLTPDETTDLSKYATVEQLEEKADVDHSHDDLYYTEIEVDVLLSSKSDTSHTHDNLYDAKGSAETALDTAKSYTDTKTSGLASTSSVDTKISTHNTSTSAHNDIRDLITELTTRLNTLADSDDTTLDQMSEIVTYIKSNKDLIDSVTTSKVSVSDIINDLTTNVSNKPLSAAQGVAIKGLIDALQTELDSHDSNTIKHITSTERTNWNAAKTHADSAHAPSNAEKNQNAFSNIAVSGQTTVAADTATDTVTFAGSNVSITTDATNDKVTFSVANGTTSAKGVVKLTNSTSSTSTTTAATPSSVKSAYDLANTAKTNAATAQSRADSAYSLAEGKVDSLSDLGVTATAAELNYMDGVTSNVQTQLNSKSASGHTHSYAGSSSAGGAATSANKLNTDAGSATKPVYFSDGIPVAGTYTLAAACAKGVTDSSSASKIGTGTSLPTERDIYYGLPTINGSHAYTSSTNIYAPTSVGTSGYVLVSSGSGAPSWKDLGSISSSTGTFTYGSDATYFTSGSSSVSIKKHGKVVTISGYIYGINNGSTNDAEFTVGTVPSGFRPPSNVYGLAWYGGNSDSLKDSRGNAPFIINSSGVMTMNAIQTTYSGRRMHFTVTYVIS